MQTNHNVILVGCPGSGKSTLYTILASVMSKMNGETAPPVVKTRRPTFAEKKTSTLKLTKASVAEVKEAFCPRVDLSVVFPKSLTCEEVSYKDLKRFIIMFDFYSRCFTSFPCFNLTHLPRECSGYHAGDSSDGTEIESVL